MPEQRWIRGSLVWIVLIVAVLAMWATFVGNDGAPTVRSIGQVAQEVRDGKVQQLVQAEGSREVQVKYKQEAGLRNAVTTIPAETDLLSVLENYGINAADLPPGLLEFEPASRWGAWLGALTFILPTLLLIGIFVFFMRQSQGSNNQAMSFGKSRARLFTGEPAIGRLLGRRRRRRGQGGAGRSRRVPQVPGEVRGSGRAHSAGRLAGRTAGYGKDAAFTGGRRRGWGPFFSISGSEFVEMFVGVGASRVRDLFDQAKRNAPCIVFVDEIDAVGRQRGAGLGGSHDEREQTLNQILVEMDGFDSSTNVIVIAATNRPDVLDPALLRPGRFDRQVILDRPDIQGRVAILEVHVRGKPLEEDVSIEGLARQTPGFSGADLENLVNEAAILAARKNRKTVGRGELTEAIDRVIAGPQRKSRVISDRERIMTAYHEAGHALVARMLAHADPVRKVSIVARGMMGGYTRVVPDEDRLFKTKAQFEDELAVYMAGHVAEDMVFEEQSTGAANDIERATGLARRMVTEFGMSRTLGPRAFGKKDELIFLGREINEQRNYSDEVAYQIDQEIQELIDAAHERARVIVEGHADKLQSIADLLLEKETIEGEELEALFESPRPRPDLVGPPSGRPGRGFVPGTPAVEQPAARSERDLPPSPGQLRPQPAD